MIDALNRKYDVLGDKEENAITISKSLKMRNVTRPKKLSLFPFYQIMLFLSQIVQLSNKKNHCNFVAKKINLCFSSALKIMESCNLGSENMENMEKMDNINRMS